MLKEAWDSVKDNIKERISNPFLGTFTLVWIVHNWKIVYAFFYFDKEWKLQTKIDYFNKYWTDNNFFWNLICVALVAVGILIITYFFLGLSRFLANYFENVIIPIVYKLSKGKIVTLEVYQNALNQIELLKEKVEKERKDKYEAIEERNQFEKRLTGNDVDAFSLNNDSVTLTPSYSTIISEAIDRFKYDRMLETILWLDKGLGFSGDDKTIDFLLQYDLIELKNGSDYTNMIYQYKSDGKLFRRQFLDSKK